MMQMFVAGVKEFSAGVEKAHKVAARMMRSELKRGGLRIRREFIRKDLSGAPGIKGGVFRKGKHVFSFIQPSGTDPTLFVGINRALRVHEEGHTFTPTKGEWLFIHKGKGDKRQIVAKVKQVVIPKRTHFRELVKDMAPEVLAKAASEQVRGYQLTISGAMDKVLTRLVS